MPRHKRILYDGAIYHILQRGHNKSKLFRKRKDYEIFKSIVKKYKDRYDFYIYHYCLMPNHLHLLLKVSKGGELPKILQGIAQAYSYHYRTSYDYTGYVYQNRYKSFLIEDDSYLLECARYIERNPLQAGMVEHLLNYSWSSYGFYTKGKSDEMISENPLFISFGQTKGERQTAYQKYVSEPRPYETIVDKAIIE